MSFIESVKNYFIRWNDFSSRSSRSEYWWPYLFVTPASYIVGFIVGYFIGYIFSIVGVSEEITLTFIFLATLCMEIFIIIASAALGVRRLHDVDKSGWWFFIIFTIIGVIPLLIWFCTKGTEGTNKYGDDPLQDQNSSA